MILRPIAGRGHEPTSSMGDDTALPPLAGRARPLYTYFRQRFAQVTNPPIDHLRERHQFSLRTILGGRATLLTEGPETARGTEFESFFLYPDALESLGYTRLEAIFESDLRGACVRLADEAEASVRAGRTALVISDTGDGTPVPMLMAVGAVHHRLVARGLRTLATLVVETDEAREAHHLACLLGFGAEAVCPRLALETVAALAQADRVGGDRPPPDEAQRRFRSAIEEAVLKIMSKMGIADVAAYCGAQIFDIVGLAPEVVELCFPGTHSPVGGVGFSELEREALDRARSDAPGEPRLRQVPQGRRAARDRCGRRRGCTRTPARRPERASRQVRALRGARRFTPTHGAPRPARARSGGRAGAAGRGRAGRVDRPAVLGRRHVPRRALGRGARDDRDRVQQPARPLELRRGRGRPGALPHRAQLADQAGRLRPLRCHAGVRGLRRRAPDQDRPGLEARRRRPAARAQGLGRDRAAPAHDAGRGADLAAAAPRHLLDRGSRAADLRPPPGQPDREDLGQAGGRERRRPRRQRRRQGARRRRPHRRLRRRHRGEPALVDQERRASVGARAGRDTDVAGRERPARARPAARRRRREDGP